MRLTPRVPYRETALVNCGRGWLKAQTEDLSLFGVRIRLQQTITCADKEKLELRIPLEGKDVVFRGRIYRKDSGKAVVLFNENEEILADIVGSFVTKSIKENGKCPYCKNKISWESELCPECRMPLDFTRIDLVRALRHIKLGDLLSGTLPEEFKRTTHEEDRVEFVGTCPAIKKVFELIRKYAATDYPVLILGETGTGKELTARAIHERSQRNNGPFVAINCAAIPRDLLEAELFGFEKGAFTGADKRKKGKIEAADGGTLFLDEIGELPLETQAKLLRFLEDLTFERLGGNTIIQANVRIIAATNRNLQDLVSKGQFREDLYYRLKVLTIELPPLRERGDDIIILAKYFLEKFSKEQGKEILGYTDEALELIQNYQWPGNVREMINVIRKAVVLTEKKYIDIDDLDIDADKISKDLSGKGIFNLREHVDRLEKELVEKAYKITGGNVSKMANMLGVSRPTVYKLLEKYRLN